MTTTALGTYQELKGIMETCLRPHELKVMKGLYEEGKGYDEIAKENKVTVNRIYQIEALATRKIKRNLEASNKTATSQYEIDRLGLSARSRNVLVAAGYTTIKSVASLTEEDFRSMRNATRRVYEEVQRKLQSL